MTNSWRNCTKWEENEQKTSKEMRQVNLIFLIFLCVEKTNLELLLKVEKPSLLADFATKIFKSNFQSVRKIAVRFSEKFLGFAEIIWDLNIPVTINAKESPLQGLDIREPADVVLIIEDILNVTDWLENNLWNSNTYFIVILEDLYLAEENLIEIFQVFWKDNVVKVFVMINNGSDVLVYTYTPFVTQQCQDIKILKVNLEANKFILKNTVNNLNGCLLNVTVVDLPPMVIFQDLKSRNGTFSVVGTEANIIYEVSKKLNFIPRFAVARDGENWGWIHPSPHGAVGEVFTKLSHFAFGLLATTLERYECLDMTVPVSPLRECITWAVPVGAAKSQAAWVQSYVNEFPIVVWIAITVSFCIGSIMFWRLMRAFESISWIEAVLYTFSVFISVPVKLPNENSLRSLFLGWTWYSFIIVISYQSLMGSRLTVPFRNPDIETIKDLLESNLHFTGFYNTFRLVTYEAEGDLKKVASRLEPTTYGIKEAIPYIVFNRSIAYMRETTSFKYFTMINPQAKGNVHFMKECAYQYNPIMVLQRNSPFTQRTNQIITRLFESGLLMKWRSWYIYEVTLPPPTAIQLTLDHLWGPLMTLFLGVLFSLVVFAAEYFFYSIGENIQQKLTGRILDLESF